MTGLSVVIVDDAALMRDGLRMLLDSQGVTVAEVRPDATDLEEVVARTQPDVVVIDLRLPPGYGLEGLTTCRSLRARWPELGLLLLSSYLEIEVAAQLMELGGGLGYLLKERVQDLGEIVRSLADIAGGGTVLDEGIGEQLLHRPANRSLLSRLSPREREVLGLLAAGHSNSGISAALFLNAKTVEGHVRQVFTKLGLVEEPASNRRVRAVLAYLREAAAGEAW